MRRRTHFFFVLFFYILLLFPPAMAANAAATEKAGDQPIKVATIERPPFSFKDEHGRLTGFSVELWDAIANHLKLPYNWDEKQVFAEMIADVVANKDQAGVANISITSSREKEADFSYPIFESGMAIAVKKGGETSIFTLIWESGILLFLGGALLLLLLIAHIVWFFERNVEDPRHDYFRDDYFGGIWDAFWWAFIIMTMGGFENEVPEKKFNRLITMIWIVASLFHLQDSFITINSLMH